MDFDNTQDSGNTDQPQQPPQTPPVVNIPDFSSAVYDPYPKKKKGSVRNVNRTIGTPVGKWKLLSQFTLQIATLLDSVAPRRRWRC